MTTPYYVYTFGWLLLCHLILVILASWLHLRCAKTCFRMFYNHYALEMQQYIDISPYRDTLSE